MGKIIGIRDVQGVGFYEAAGTVERQFSPYDGIGQDTHQPYDLSVPGRVAEIKRVLKALGQHYSDPNRNPADPQLEATFRHMDQSPEFADAWDGPTADAFALTVGRHRGRFPVTAPSTSPLIQLNRFSNELGQDVIIGGPQPTVPGLEALALAAHEVLKDSVQLDQYLAWRGGSLECASLQRCTAPDQVVTPTTFKGRDWDPRGWTVAWVNGPAAKANPALLDQLSLVDKALDFTWQQAPAQTSEAGRKEVADKLAQLRLNRHEIVKQLNAGAPAPTCDDPSKVYDRDRGTCVPRCDSGKRWDPSGGVCVIDLPPVEVPVGSISTAQAAGVAALLIGGMALLAKYGNVGGFGG